MQIISREEAKASGVKRFFTGEPCLHGHVAERFVASSSCTACATERYLAWHARNPGASDARAKRWREENPERDKANRALWAENNKERRDALDKTYYERDKPARIAKATAWLKAHPEYRRAWGSNRQAKIRGSEGQHTRQQIADMLIEQIGKCNACGCDISEKYEIDHVMPVSKGGGNGIDNIQLLCPTCNRRKSARHPAVFVAMLNNGQWPDLIPGGKNA